MHMKDIFFQTIGNRVRAQLIVCLSHGESTVSELVSRCNLSQSAVSQHLAKLRESGCVQARRSGREMYYQLADRRLSQVCRDLIELSKICERVVS